MLKRGIVKKGNFLIFKVKSNRLKVSRFGFIVSTRVSKKAVARNKIKRRLRNIVRELLGFLAKDIDGVFIALPGSEKASFEEIKRDILFLLKKSGVLKDDKRNNN